MSQHDMTLDNASGLGFRSDANNALQALASQSSGASSPSPTFPCQVWGDTSTGRLKQRNAANTAWLDKGPLDSPLRDAASQGEFVADTGAANAYVCNFVPAITTRSEATPIRFKATNANTGACTINDGVGVVALVGGSHTALQGGEIVANGIAWIQWNSSVGGGSYVLLFCTGAAEQTAPATKGQHAIQLQQMSALVGGVLNGKMSVTTAGTTATYTADEVSVKTALGGASWLLPSFSKTINLATTGAGGMDTGTAPVNGYVALYAIYNQSTATSALLAANATSVAAPSIYGGSNMPSGYTYSALISVWPTNGTGQMVIGSQVGRDIYYVPVTLLNTTSPVTTRTSLSITGGVPPGAKKLHLNHVVIETGVGIGVEISVMPTSTGIAEAVVSATVTGQQSKFSSNYSMIMVTSQTIFYAMASLNAGQFIIISRGYEF